MNECKKTDEGHLLRPQKRHLPALLCGYRGVRYSRTAPLDVRIYCRDIGLVDELPKSMVDSASEERPNEIA